jgi:hypothetical protein
MLGQSGRDHQLGHRVPAQSREDLACEDRRVGEFPGPFANGPLVRGVLGAADLGRASAVCRIALFRP